VHSDWLQLLEEYGVVGLLLFLLMSVTVFTVLLVAVVKSRFHYAAVGAALAAVAIAFHSLGDFNMQIPATVWMFVAILAISIAGQVRSS
jgi:O-antigen ligase